MADTELKVAEDLSRMEGAYGAEMIGKLKRLRVLVIGLHGLGIETAKNLILAGPKQVVVSDNGVAQIQDLGCNFYLRESDVGKKTRGEACVAMLGELNPNVNVDVHKGAVTEEVLANFDVVVVTDNTPLDDLKKFNKFCHNRTRIKKTKNATKASGEEVPDAIAFIYATLNGASATMFTDFGPAHVVTDADGEQGRTVIIDHITNAKNGAVTIDGDRHLLNDGEHIKFEEVKGMSDSVKKAVTTGDEEESQDVVFKPTDVVTDINQIHEIKSTKNPKKFLIGDTTKLGEYKSGGIGNQVKLAVVKKYQTLEEQLHNPRIDDGYVDFMKFGRSEQLHFAKLATWEFQAKHKHLPAVHSEKDAAEVFALAQEILAKHKKTVEEAKQPALVVELDKDIITKYALYAATELTAFAALFGGVVAQEVTKITGKFKPVEQWLHFDAFELLQDKVPADSQPIGSRYDHQIAVFGKAWQEKAGKQKVFLVGCGALGCEYMKAFAMMGLGAGGGEVTATDDDKIELSNLSRQFLFRRKHVGKAKSVSAGESADGMNPGLGKALKTSEIRVEPKTEDVFHDRFWDSLDFVVNALDNNLARRYVDTKCVLHRKPLFESGTLGTKANTVICLPGLTPSYSEGAVAGEEQGIAKCTLRNFPSMDLHCIEWAREKFDDLFVSGADNANSFMDSSEKFLEKLKQSPLEQADILKAVKTWVDMSKAPTFALCLQIIFDEFIGAFRDAINDLKHNFPADARIFLADPSDPDKKIDGGPFWHGHKRFPNTAEFDPKNELHLDYVFHGANILASVFGIPEIKDREKVRQMAAALKASPWSYSGKKVDLDEDKKTEEEKKKEAASKLTKDEDKEIVDSITSYLKKLDLKQLKSLKPADFEKDDDKNHHIDWITAATNLRCWNYDIKLTTRQKCRMIAGKIIPAIATTTAMITGFVQLEIYKYLMGAPLTAHRAATVNLATNTYCVELLPDPKRKKTGMDPETYMKVVAVPEGFTCWDSVIIQGTPETTMQQFFDAFTKQHYGCKIDYLFAPTGQHFYNHAEMRTKKDLFEARCKQPLVKLYTELVGPIFPKDRRYLILDCTVEDKSGDSGMVPRLKFCF